MCIGGLFFNNDKVYSRIISVTTVSGACRSYYPTGFGYNSKYCVTGIYSGNPNKIINVCVQLMDANYYNLYISYNRSTEIPDNDTYTLHEFWMY